MSDTDIEARALDARGAQPHSRISRLHRSGNSYGLYIPKLVAAQMAIAEGEEIRMYVIGRVLCIEPVTRPEWAPGVVAVRGVQARHEG